MFGAPPIKKPEVPPGVVMVLVDVDEHGDLKFLALMEDGSIMSTLVPVVAGNEETLNKYFGGKPLDA
jgi:hypothetical protein